MQNAQMEPVVGMPLRSSLMQRLTTSVRRSSLAVGRVSDSPWLANDRTTMAPSTPKSSSASAWFSIFRTATRDHNRSARSFSRPAWAIATLAWRALDIVGIVSEEGKWFLPIVTTFTRCSAHA